MLFGLLRTVAYIVGVWFIWRWLDGVFGGHRKSNQHFRRDPRRPGDQERKRRANDAKEGEYVDFEEVQD